MSDVRPDDALHIAIVTCEIGSLYKRHIMVAALHLTVLSFVRVAIRESKRRSTRRGKRTAYFFCTVVHGACVLLAVVRALYSRSEMRHLRLRLTSTVP